MLNPNNDRIDYGALLAPPIGFSLDFAVGTTYSLDLDALVGASLALGLGEETDSDLMSNPVCLLEALRSVGDKVALFCEGGQIHMPHNPSELYILLEKMVFSVKTDKPRGKAHYPSFHPKFWLIRYIDDDGQYIYRVIVLSRNLTFDRSWDVVYSMDGEVAEDEDTENEPVCDFLRYLIKHLPSDENGKEKAKEIRSLIKELPKVWFLPDEGERFTSFEFMPNGIKNTNGEAYCFGETALFTNRFDEVLIMSPFISAGIIKGFNERNHGSSGEVRNTLFTRKMSLSKLKPEDVSSFRVYTMKDAVVDGETAISEENADIHQQDIHAKIYMTRKYADTSLYLGSLNASHNAIDGNIEFMIRLDTKNRYLNMDKLLDSFFCGKEDGPDNPFVIADITEDATTDDEDTTNLMNALIKEINRSGPFAEVVPEENLYSIHVHFGECDRKGFKVEIKPLLSGRMLPLGSDIIFPNLDMMHLSEFYVLKVSSDDMSIERVLIIPTSGIPEGREKSVITNVVSNKECFYRYIAFLLGDNAIVSALETSNTSFGGGSANGHSSANLPALYEKMLQTAASNPSKFRGIEYLMKTISDDGIIPEDFKQMYETFKKAVGLYG